LDYKTSTNRGTGATGTNGKAHLHAKPGAQEVKELDHNGILHADHTIPGHFSVDQFVSSTHGHLLHSCGKESEEAKYSSGTIFVVEVSGMVFCHLQVSLNAAKTLTGKHLIERDAQTGGVDVCSYQGDNGVFWSLEFQKDLEICGQTIKFSGVGTHHQKDVAEYAIWTITECACTMILHTIIHFGTWLWTMPPISGQNNMLPQSA